jgi:hypothetical protein
VRARSVEGRSRRGATIVLAAILLVAMLAMIAFSLDVGYIVLVRTQLQVAADASAMAAVGSLGSPPGEVIDVAKQYAAYHFGGGVPVQLIDKDVEFGNWDTTTRIFAPTAEVGNAIRVTARRDSSTNGESPLFFANVFGKRSFSMSASAVAMANPRDIAFVVDLSGSMNDDTEPAWATGAINSAFAPKGYPTVGHELMKNVYEDFGFGAYPGAMEYIGKPLGVASDSYAYAEMTKDGGPLTQNSIAAAYRITPTDTEAIRKQKA